MSRRSSAKYHHGGSAHHGGHSAHHHQQPPAAAGASYTLAHAGRQVRLGPVAFWVVVGTLVIMAVWSVTTATYFAFRDDVLTRLIARQADMQFAYEDRIAELRSQVDRVSSRQLLDQEQYEQKLDQILRRQTALESRAGALNGLGDITGSVRPPARSEQRPSRPTPIGDKGAFILQSSEPPIPYDPRSSLLAKGSGGMGGVLARLQASLDRVEQRQAATLNAIEESYESKARRIRIVLSELGVDLGKAAPAETTGGLGGPFVPARLPKESLGFERQLHRIALARAHVSRLTRTLGTVPVRKPVDGDLEPASGFGVRNDPFTNSPALHTGLDLVGDAGDPVRAAADGKVTTAGWSGGYGKVVDVDHGNGIITRYGHLSAIEVQVGQTIKTGQLLGRIGSTGRSTGPHLHYETRVGGKPVDPQKFLRAGQKLQSST
jgi:murein DD-endopeptidase MepM/ murein hydrolase activator NlpD